MTGIVLAAMGARWVGVTDMDVVVEGITLKNVEANAGEEPRKACSQDIDDA